MTEIGFSWQGWLPHPQVDNQDKAKESYLARQGSCKTQADNQDEARESYFCRRSNRKSKQVIKTM